MKVWKFHPLLTVPTVAFNQRFFVPRDHDGPWVVLIEKRWFLNKSNGLGETQTGQCNIQTRHYECVKHGSQTFKPSMLLPDCCIDQLVFGTFPPFKV